MKTKEKKLIVSYLLIDLLLLNLSFLTMVYIHDNSFYSRGLVDFLLLLNISWGVAILFYPKGNLFLRDGFRNRVKRQIYRFAVYLSIVLFGVVLLNLDSLSRFILFGSIGLFFFLKLIVFFFIYTYLGLKRKKGRYVRKILIVGDSEAAHEINGFFNSNPEIGYKIVGYIDDDSSSNKNYKYLGCLNDFQKLFSSHVFDEIIIALPLTMKCEINRFVKLSDFNGIRIHLIPDYYNLLKRNVNVQLFGNVPLVNVRNVPLDEFSARFLKRSFDIVFSLFVLIFFSPIYFIIGLAVKIETKGPALYKPVRIGKNGKEFAVLKFRSMRDSDSAYGGTKSTIAGDPRVTKVGAFIRKTNIDELPQFFNVLKGEMSVIGPRPHRINLNSDLQNKMPEYMVRSYVRPGLTGWAQVNGWRGPTETKIQYQGRTLHDIWYIENWAFMLDLYIIMLTVFGNKVKKNAF